MHQYIICSSSFTAIIKFNSIIGTQTAKKKLGNISKLKSLNWSEQYTIEEGICETYNWVTENL
jgi:hypothetical protein